MELGKFSCGCHSVWFFGSLLRSFAQLFEVNVKEVHAVLHLSHSLLVHGSLIASKPSRRSSEDELITKPGKADKTNEIQKDN